MLLDYINESSLKDSNWLYFTAPWCKPCQTISPLLNSLPQVMIVKIDVDKHAEVARKFNVSGLPTFINQKTGSSKTGSMTSQAIREFFVDKETK